jgi:hypothetical protein
VAGYISLCVGEKAGFLNQLSDYQLLNNDSDRESWLNRWWVRDTISARIQGVLNFPLSVQANPMAVLGIGYFQSVHITVRIGFGGKYSFRLQY